jgi:hypothetical protein
MKRLTLIFFPFLMFIFFACQKEQSFETGFTAPATGTLKDSSGDCDSMSVNGTYTENQSLTPANTVTVTLNITASGSYKVFTDTVNGFSFLDSGFFAAPGTYQVTLKGSGKPILPITSDFTVSFRNSICNFSVDVVAATSSGAVNDADTAWMFNEGTSHYQGHVDSALVKMSGTIPYLNIYGKPASNDTTFYVQLQQTSPTPTGTYSTTNGTAVFEFKTPAGNTIYDSRQTDGSNLTFTVIAYNTTTKVLEAIFSGTVKDGAAGTKTISSGKLKVQVQ